MPDYDLIVIGAGISGMTAAIGAANEGLEKILVIEKEACVGGIINQCIHNGFGEKFMGEPVTGPEYVDFIEKELVANPQIELLLNTTVLDSTSEKKVTYVNSKDGVKSITAGAIIFSMGANEKYSGRIVFPTNGLTGIFTVGEAHKIINLEGYLPGRNAVIVVKDKWGFIVARRLSIEGGNIVCIVIEKSFEEIVDEEILDIIDGFEAEIIENSRVVEIEGKTRIEKLKIKNLNDQSIQERECDSLLLSVAFLPEISILKKLNLDIDRRILGIKVSEFKTSLDGFFACGNIIYGEDAFHMAEADGMECGVKAAQYVKKIYR